MNNQINTLRIQNILKKFSEGNHKKAYNELASYVNEFPDDLSATYNLGVMSEKNNYVDDAIKYYSIVIKKDKNHWQSRNNLYLIFFHRKKYQEALVLVNDVLAIKPKYQPALRDKAHILFYLKKLDEALNNIIESIRLNKSDYIALNIMGMIYTSLNSHEIAKKIYLKTIELNPSYYPTYSNLGKCLNLLKETDLAIKYIKKCLEIKPDFDEAINNLASVYTVCGEYEKAIPLYLKILNKNKQHKEANQNIAIAYFYINEISKADFHFKEAEKIDQNDDKFRKNYSMFLLYIQNYEKAWKIIDGRLKLQDFQFEGSYLKNIKKKIWSNEKIKNNDRLLIIKEQGVGDEILYSTIYPDLLKRFPSCKIETEERLISTFKRSYNAKNQIIPFKEISGSKDKIKKIDKIIFAGSLGRIFRNSKKDFPTKNLIKAKKNEIINISQVLKKIDKNKKIGIAWKSKRYFFGEGKSLNIEDLSPILSLKQFTFINLQYGEVEEDLQKLKKKNNLEIVTLSDVDLFNDFEKISALLSNLDLFITVGNSTAHLAGALNVPTWLIKPKSYALFHYWHQPNNYTPWYPSIEIFEQTNNINDLLKKIENRLLTEF